MNNHNQVAVQNVEQIIEQGKIARTQALRANPGLVLGTVGTFVVLYAVATALILGRPAHQRALEATVQMERLAVTLSHAKRIAPETMQEVTELIHRSRYECTQAECDAHLERRNHAAQLALLGLLSKAANSSKREVSGTDGSVESQHARAK